MRYAFSLLLFLLMGYFFVRRLYFRPIQLDGSLIQHGSPIQYDIMKPINDMIPSIKQLTDWIPGSKKYAPNQYGYGGIDPATGNERKGGDGNGIPDEISVGWWNGNISYSEKHLSPVQDSEEIPSAKISHVGWWGDDWMS
jgi:hypothetical protein